MVFYGFLGSFAAGLMPAVGAAPALLGCAITRSMNDCMLSCVACVMLAASFFSLLAPSTDVSVALYRPQVIATTIAALGIFLVAPTIAALNEILPLERLFQGREGRFSAKYRRVSPFVLAITLHNIPEGPVVAVAMATLGKSLLTSFDIATLTGLVVPVVGALSIGLSTHILLWALAFAVGATLFAVSHEITPETRRHGHQWRATGSLTLGLCLMMLLDVALRISRSQSQTRGEIDAIRLQ